MWGPASKQVKRLGIVEEALAKLVQEGLNGLRVFDTFVGSPRWGKGRGRCGSMLARRTRSRVIGGLAGERGHGAHRPGVAVEAGPVH